MYIGTPQKGVIFLSSALYIELSARYGFEILRTPDIEVGAIVSGCRDTDFRGVSKKGGVNMQALMSFG